MPVIRNGKSMTAYKGTYSPLNIFKGAKKIAGYIEEFNSGNAILVNGITYNDIADVVVKGNTVQLSDYYAKDGMLTQTQETLTYADRVADFAGKIRGSVVENPHIAKYKADTSLVIPSGFSAENVQNNIWAGYNQLMTLDGAISKVQTFVSGQIPQNLFSFNVVAEFEKAYGAVPSADQSLAGKIAWLKANLSDLTSSWYGYGICPSGNLAHFACWQGSAWGTPSDSTSATPTIISKGGSSYPNFIDAEGKIHFIAYTNACDGVTSSAIYTDYVKITLKFKTTYTPNPLMIRPITSNLPANTYKYTSTDGIYEFTLTEDLRGINTTYDKVVFDRVSHRGYLERRIKKIVLDGVPTPSLWGSAGAGLYNAYYMIVSGMSDIIHGSQGFCNYFMNTTLAFYNSVANAEVHYMNTDYNQVCFSVLKSQYPTGNDFKNWLIAQYNLNIPVIIYGQMKTRTRVPLTFTKVASSSKTEVPMNFLTSTPSLDYPADVFDVTSGKKLISRNADNSQRTEISLPTLRKIGAVSDEYNPKTGKLTKKISDWVTLDGAWTWVINGTTINHKRMRTSEIFSDFQNGVASKPSLSYKWDSKLLSTLVWGVGDAGESNQNGFAYITAFHDDTGFNDSVTPTTNEMKAYFYGWKMCNADGTSPYYKSEVPYTPATWAEWGNAGTQNIVKDSTGAEITANGIGTCGVEIVANFKTSTKYGILYNLVSTNLDGNLFVGFNTRAITFDNLTPAQQTLGNHKAVATSYATISNNSIIIFTGASSTSGTKFKIKNVQIFELPTGSQIESDFNTLTADQLAAKYTFNGLCTKNWKHVTDGLGQTATLPTASYDGYTPYKMLYQLATPVESDFGTPTPLPTYYPTTIIETDTGNVAPATIDATVKVEDMTL